MTLDIFDSIFELAQQLEAKGYGLQGEDIRDAASSSTVPSEVMLSVKSALTKAKNSIDDEIIISDIENILRKISANLRKSGFFPF